MPRRATNCLFSDNLGFMSRFDAGVFLLYLMKLAVDGVTEGIAELSDILLYFKS
jgi:hypothetical protein